MEISIIYSDESQLDKINHIVDYFDGNTGKVFPSFVIIDSLSKNGKKQGRMIKGRWGAKLDPFVIITDGEKPIKAFYSETGEDVLDSLRKYINNYYKISL